VDLELKVGGPASTGSCDKPGIAPWGAEFLAACAERKLPLDFFSTHPYPTLYPFDPDGSQYMIWDGPDRLLVDARGYDKLLLQSEYPHVERHYTEWSSSTSSRDLVHESAFMAPFVVQNNWRARGLMSSLAFWTISDICEEIHLGDTPFHGGFGLINIQGLKKPSYHGYWFLSRLGSELLVEGDAYVVTRRRDGSLAILLWNYCHYRAETNDSRLFEQAKPEEIYDLFDIQPARDFSLIIQGIGKKVRIQSTRFDRDHGSIYDAWIAIGAPNHIRPTDLDVLRRQMELDVSVKRLAAPTGKLQLETIVQPFGVTLLEISPE
jgi:xylan 1,4-beta-xylosidase